MFNIETNFKNYKQMQKELNTDKKCIKYLEELIWEGVPVSPFDKSSKVYKYKNGKYRCKNTGKYFTVLTGTIFQGTKLSLVQWFHLIYLEITNRKGIPSTTAADILGVTQKTAWYMLHKIRKCMSKENFQELSGTVEADEFVAGGLLKNMHYNKKLEAKAKGGYRNKIPMHGMVERNGNAVITVLKNTEADVLNAKVLKYVKHGSNLYTDDTICYSKMPPFYKHEQVIHSKCSYVRGIVHTNSIESLWASMARTLHTYIHVTEKFLQNYANEVVFRYNTRKMKCIDSFIWCLQNIPFTKVTWKEIRLGQY